MTTAILKKELKFTGVNLKMVEQIWPLVKSWVAKGLTLERGLYKAEDIHDHLSTKKMQLWVAIDPEENKIMAALVTQIALYPQAKACWIILAAGSEMDEWIKFMVIIKGWAKHEGCDRILSFSRDGWIKKLAPYGFKKSRTLIECFLEDGNEDL